MVKCWTRTEILIHLDGEEESWTSTVILSHLDRKMACQPSPQGWVSRTRSEDSPRCRVRRSKDRSCRHARKRSPLSGPEIRGLKDLDPDNRKLGKTAAEWHIQNPGPFFNDLQAKPANLGWMVEMAGKFFTLGLDSPVLAVEQFCSQLVTFAAETTATDSIFTFPSPFVIAF